MMMAVEAAVALAAAQAVMAFAQQTKLFL